MINLLVPTDFSYTSRHSIKQYLRDFVAGKDPIKVTLLNAYEIADVDVGNAVVLNDHLKSQSRSSLEQMKSEISLSSNDLLLEFELISHIGSIENVIKEVLSRGDFSLIVMGKNGGSYIEKVSKVLNKIHSKSPLIIVYPPATARSLEVEDQLA